MAETGAMWVDGIVPSVPYRQWVLSFFIPSRLLFAPRPEMLLAVLGVVTRALSDDVIRRAGQHTMCLRVPTLTESVLPIPGALTANHEGFSLNAAVACGATQWDKLERLCRYLARKPLSIERLASEGDGLVVHERKSPFRDATTHCLFEALVFVDKDVLERSVRSPPGHSYTSLQVPARVRSRMRRAPS